MGTTVLRVLVTRVGKVSSLGQKFEQLVIDVTIQEGPERPEGWEGSGGEMLTLGALGWSRDVFWAGVTRERHLWGAHGRFNSGGLGDFSWGQTGVGRGGSL